MPPFGALGGRGPTGISSITFLITLAAFQGFLLGSSLILTLYTKRCSLPGVWSPCPKNKRPGLCPWSDPRIYIILNPTSIYFSKVLLSSVIGMKEELLRP